MNRVESFSTDNFNYNHDISDEACFRIHSHKKYEIAYLLEGEMIRYIEEKEYRLKPGDLVLIPSDIPHGWKNYPRHFCRRISIHFSPEFLSNAEQSLIGAIFNVNQPCYSDNPGGNIDVFIRSLLDCGKLEGEIQGLAIHSRIVSLLTEIYLRTLKPAPREYVNKQMENILRYLSDNLRKPVSLETLSKRFSISKNYLNLMFQKEIGTTVNNYIREQRLYLAREKMEEGKYAEEAAFAAGFNDYSTFFRAYKNRFGVSPTQAVSKPVK